MRFTDIQPKDGDRMLLCAHPHSGEPHHFYMVQGKAPAIVRPDGSVIKVKPEETVWMMVCDRCNKVMGVFGFQSVITGDAVWKGNEPVIEADKENT